MSANKQIKQFAYKAGVLTLIGSAIIINEQILRHRLDKQNKDFANQKNILENKIKSLEQKNKILEARTSFRFYEHLPNGADYKQLTLLNNLTFHNDKPNPFEQFRPQELTQELIEENDSLIKEHIPYSRLYDEQEQYLMAFHNSDSIPAILENGQLFLQSLLNTMKQHNHAMGKSLSRNLNNTEEENEREFKARYFMFQIKTKNKMYNNRHELTSDFYRTVFLKNISIYKQTARILTKLVDSLSLEHQKEITQDSLKFEKNKQQRIDSLLNSKTQTINKPKFKNFNFAAQHFTNKH